MSMRSQSAALAASAPVLPFYAPEPSLGTTRPAPRKPMVVSALFAGIGGIELGLRRAGHHVVELCENDAGARAVLAARFPGVPNHADVRTVRALHRDTTLVTAGFPCQDLSQAGLTRDIDGARSGLVGEVFRLIAAHRTPWLLLENVPFMLQLARGKALDVIVSALEELGYRWAYRVVNTRSFGLPQRRERVYLVAALEGDPREVLFADEGDVTAPADTAAGESFGFYWTEGLRGLGWAVDAVPTLKGGSTVGIPSPPAILMPDRRVVTPDLRDVERLQGFPANWTRPAETVVRRGARWKLVGNAVSVPVAAWIGRRLRKPGRAVLTDVCPLRAGSSWPRAAWNVGDGRFTCELSAHPVQRRRLALHEFLKYPVAPLSERATAGFLSRTEVSSLRFPAGFLSAVRQHLAHVRRDSAAP